MSTVQSITVVLDDGSSFQVDTTANCVLVWSDAGWDVLSEYYDKVKHDPTLAKQVRDRKCQGQIQAGHRHDNRRHGCHRPERCHLPADRVALRLRASRGSSPSA